MVNGYNEIIQIFVTTVLEVKHMEEKSILIQRKYGAVRLRLAEIMDSRGMTRNQLSRLTGTRYEVIHKWYGGKVEKLDLDVLARICYVLDCEVSDLLVYEEAEE